jgi:flagellar basal-body rod protein FlgG
LETSNVNTVKEMVGMIANLRAYEANQKSIQSMDHTLDKLINEVGRV